MSSEYKASRRFIKLEQAIQLVRTEFSELIRGGFMKKIVIALTALAGVVFLSGCAYGYTYDGGHIGNVAWGYGYAPYRYSSYYHPFYGNWDCVHHFDATYCARG